MKRAILLLASLACCGAFGCDSQTTAKAILTVGLNARIPAARTSKTVPTGIPSASELLSIEMQGGAQTSDELPAVESSATPRKHSPPKKKIPSTKELVVLMQEINQLRNVQGLSKTDVASRLSGLIDQTTRFADQFTSHAGDASVLAQQVREAQAVALDLAAAMLPDEFSVRRDEYFKVAFGQSFDLHNIEKGAVNRLVTGYLIVPKLPADAAQVLALHSVTFPNHAMNVELYTTIAERLVGEGKLPDGVTLARAGLAYCSNHTDVGRLRDRVKRIYRENPGEIGVPMNFAGPTIRERRFMLNSLKGRPVLVVFWAPDHPIADAFMEDCLSLAKRCPETDVEVVGVNLHTSLKDVEAWLTKRQFPCRQVFSNEKGHQGLENPIAKFYGVEALPAFFLLDREGIVIARGAGELDVIENALRQCTTSRLALVSSQTN